MASVKHVRRSSPTTRARLPSRRRKENTVKQRSIKKWSKNKVDTRFTSLVVWPSPYACAQPYYHGGIRQPWKAVSVFILDLISKIDCTYVDQTKQYMRLLCTHPSVENLLCSSVLLTSISSDTYSTVPEDTSPHVNSVLPDLPKNFIVTFL